MEIESLRYAEDSPDEFESSGASFSARGRRERIRLLSHDVRITEPLLPELHSAMRAVAKNLRAAHTIEFYARSGPIPQAWCVPLGGEVHFAVVVSSGLVDLMSADELRFVIGHEIGHYLFGHHRRPPAGSARGLGALALLHSQRAAEISADRAGFVCAPSEKDAFAAIVKTASGLSSRHLNLDAASYLQQAKEVMAAGDESAVFGTHPILPLRARALHWFAMSEPFYRWRGEKKEAPLSAAELDDRILRDFAAAEKGGFGAHSEKAVSQARVWCLLMLFASDNVLSKSEQKSLVRLVGESDAHKAIKFVRENGIAAAEKKEQAALKNLRGLPLAGRRDFYRRLHITAEEAGCDDASRRHLAKIEKILGVAPENNDGDSAR